MWQNGSLKRGGAGEGSSLRHPSQNWVTTSSQHQESHRWSTMRTAQTSRVEMKARRGSRPLLTTPEREPWSRQNLMKRQKEPPEKQHQLVYHQQTEQTTPNHPKASGGCGLLMARGILLILHTLYWTCGLFLLFLSLWSLWDPSRGPFLNLIAAAGEDLLRLVCFFQFVAGCLVLSLGIAGALATIRQNRGWMSIFLILAVVAACVEALFTLLALLYQPAIVHSFKQVLQDRLRQDYGREGFYAFTDAIDFTQYKFSCCGIVSPSDYRNTRTTRWRWRDIHPASESRLEVPRTCCALLNAGAYQAWRTPQPENQSACQAIKPRLQQGNRLKKGCHAAIVSWAAGHRVLLLVVSGGIISIQGLTIGLTGWMYRRTDKTPRVHYV